MPFEPQPDTTVLTNTRYGDRYFSSNGAVAESRHVFLAGNRLPERFHDGFHIGELGFGTGRNMLAALHSWIGSGQTGRLIYTGFEADLLTPPRIADALATMPELERLAEQLVSALVHGAVCFTIGPLSASIVLGDARRTVPRWAGTADAWFLDGFAPSKNPEMWEPDLMSAVARRTARAGSFATYSSAGHVRRALDAAGFSVIRCRGYGHKRHMLRGILDPAS